MKKIEILWDAHNYLAMDVQVGSNPDSEDYEDVSEEEMEGLSKKLEELEAAGLETSCTVDWSTDPEEFAASLEAAAKWLREITQKLDGARHFIRTDID